MAPATHTPEIPQRDGSACVNDIHSQLNATHVGRIIEPDSVEDLHGEVARCIREGVPMSVCGLRHAMGGQQFGQDCALFDLRKLNRLLSLDGDRGLLTAQAGMDWPTLIDGYLAAQGGPGRARWGIAQKQTGADRLSVGGAVAANVHGRGLTMPPMVADIESLDVVTADGPRRCSRSENADLFRLVVGGYGLFGIVTSVTLRLRPRVCLRRIVRVIDIDDAANAARRRIEEGCVYGDFQFDIDPRSPDFLTKGVFACYLPTPGEAPADSGKVSLTPELWLQLVELAHRDKSEAFKRYAQHYVATDGQCYWSDTHQLGTYVDGYHDVIDRRLGSACKGSEVITELYVPHERLIDFLRVAAAMLVSQGAAVIYGTIRLIRRDEETFLPWARGDMACVVFNLHVDHTDEGLLRARTAFRGLIDLALVRGGSFYLTYHRFWTATQVERAYPNIREFLAEKRRRDPRGIFQSEFYRSLARAFA